MVKDSAYRSLYDAIKETAEYHVVFEAPTSMHTVFAAKDGTAIGGVVTDRSGAQARMSANFAAEALRQTFGTARARAVHSAKR